MSARRYSAARIRAAAERAGVPDGLEPDARDLVELERTLSRLENVTPAPVTDADFLKPENTNRRTPR